MSNQKWKDYFLKSGVPLEFEIKKILDKYECFTKYDESYLRENELNVETEFSYDINSVSIKDQNFFELMIECKYRDKSTNWIFLPESTKSDKRSLANNSVLHPNDYFTFENKFHFNPFQMPYLAESCNKGIEITTHGQNPKSITQAISQLSYAMSENFLNTIIHHLESNDGCEDNIHYHIPIIVTTANLYLLNDNVTIKSIKDCDTLDEVATKQKHLIFNCNIGKDLEDYNKKVLSKILKRFDKNFLNRRIGSEHFNNFDIFVSIVSRVLCPSNIYIVQHTEKSETLDDLFEMLKEVAYPDKTIKFIKNKEIKKHFREKKKHRNEIQTKLNNLKKNDSKDDLPF